MKKKILVEISDTKKLKDLQKEFNRQFPFLQLEFYAKSHEDGQRSSEKVLLKNDLLVGAVRAEHNNGQFVIDGNMKVGDFEQRFQELFGLNVQVYRKSYGKWLQTWATDVWSLNEQNRRGQILGNR
jgi:hypothetical protein